jgi:hypothetical protein
MRREHAGREWPEVAFFVIWRHIARGCEPQQTDGPTKRRHLTTIICAELTSARGSRVPLLTLASDEVADETDADVV